MQSNLISHVLLYLAIIATSLCLRERKPYIFGVISIAICLLFFDLSDIEEYRNHYELAGRAGFDHVVSLYNFEPGYVLLVVLIAHFLPFEAFYVIAISLAIHAYIKFFEQSVGKGHYVYAVFFLSSCLYFVSFTLRTTIASTFLAYAILCLKNKKNILAVILITVGATFHVVIAPMIILPILNKYSGLIAKHYLSFYAIVIAISIAIAKNLSLTPFVGVNEIVDLKISSYDDANINSNSIFFGLWAIAFAGSYVSFRKFDEFDRVLVIASVATILLLYPFEFVQGRFMWLTSFVFAYIFAKGTFMRIDFGSAGRLILVNTLPLVVFFRF